MSSDSHTKSGFAKRWRTITDSLRLSWNTIAYVVRIPNGWLLAETREQYRLWPWLLEASSSAGNTIELRLSRSWEPLIVDHGMGLLIRADRSEWMPVFTGLSVRQFRTLVRIVVGRCGQQARVGRPWGLSLADRVLLTAVYYRTNLTFRQVGLLFGISKSAAHRVV
jgi:hypothetical protein